MSKRLNIRINKNGGIDGRTQTAKALKSLDISTDEFTNLGYEFDFDGNLIHSCLLYKKLVKALGDYEFHNIGDGDDETADKDEIVISPPAFEHEPPKSSNKVKSEPKVIKSDEKSASAKNETNSKDSNTYKVLFKSDGSIDARSQLAKALKDKEVDIENISKLKSEFGNDGFMLHKCAMYKEIKKVLGDVEITNRDSPQAK